MMPWFNRFSRLIANPIKGHYYTVPAHHGVVVSAELAEFSAMVLFAVLGLGTRFLIGHFLGCLCWHRHHSQQGAGYGYFYRKIHIVLHLVLY